MHRKLSEKLTALGIPPEKQTGMYFDQLLPESITIEGTTCRKIVYQSEKVLPVKRYSPLLVPHRQEVETLIDYLNAKLLVRAKTEWEAKAKMIIQLVDLELLHL